MNDKDFLKKGEEALHALLKEYGVHPETIGGVKGLSFMVNDADSIAETIAALPYLSIKLSEATLKMYVTTQANKPNQETTLAREFHAALNYSLDRMFDDFFEQVGDDSFVSRVSRLDS